MALQGKAAEMMAKLKSLRGAQAKGATVKPGGLSISESVFQPPDKGGRKQPPQATVVVEGAKVGEQVLRRFTFGTKRAENIYPHIDAAIAFSEGTQVGDDAATALPVGGFTLNQLRVLRDHAETILERVASLVERGLQSDAGPKE